MGFFDLMLDPTIAVTGLTAIAAFATILTIAMPLMERDRLGTRLKTVATRRDELRQRQRESFNTKGKKQLRNTPAAFMKRVVEQVNLQKILESPETRLKLIQAGLRGQAPLVTFMFFRLIMPFIVFFAAIVYLFLVKDYGMKPPMRFLASLGAAGVGFYMPNLFVQNLIDRRKKSIQMAFPDTLDLLLICVESGMSIEAALNRVAGEVGSQCVELAEELGLTTAELSYLSDRRQAYDNLGKRVDLPGVKAVTMALIQSEKFGTPLGQSLRVMAQENRDMRMAAAEKKAAALPAQLTVPMIVFFLPVLFVVILGPAILSVMKTFH